MPATDARKRNEVRDPAHAGFFSIPTRAGSPGCKNNLRAVVSKQYFIVCFQMLITFLQ